MRYTLWSTEGLLGDSQLDFVMREDRRRIGVLDPTELGEILLGIAPGTPIGTPWPCDALTLELRDEGGAVIPTEEIWVRDIEYVMSLVHDEQDEQPLSDEERAQIRPDVQDDGDDSLSPEWQAQIAEWSALHGPRDSTRFQIHVRLVDDASIP